MVGLYIAAAAANQGTKAPGKRHEKRESFNKLLKPFLHKAPSLCQKNTAKNSRLSPKVIPSAEMSTYSEKIGKRDPSQRRGLQTPRPYCSGLNTSLARSS